MNYIVKYLFLFVRESLASVYAYTTDCSCQKIK